MNDLATLIARRDRIERDIAQERAATRSENGGLRAEVAASNLKTMTVELIRTELAIAEATGDKRCAKYHTKRLKVATKGSGRPLIEIL